MHWLADLFRRSPFGPLHEHMRKVRECSQLLRPLIDAAVAGDSEAMERIAQQISEAESEADSIKDGIRTQIPKGIFLPVHRDDLLGYLKTQDDIADTVEDIAVLLRVKRLVLPEKLLPEFRDLVETVLKACELCEKVTDELEDLAGSSFGGVEATKLLAVVDEVEQTEDVADGKQFAAAQKLFSLEGEISPVDIMMWFQILGEIGKLGNHAQKTADRVRRLLARS